MSRDLEQLRDHARRKAEQTEPERPQSMSAPCRYPGWMGLDHSDCQCDERSCGCRCHDADRVLPTESDRTLWAQIADEIDEYLRRNDDQQELFA